MEFHNKKVLRQEIKKRIDQYVRQFPYTFFGNIIGNLLIFTATVGSFVFAMASVKFITASGKVENLHIFAFGIVFSIACMFIMRITWRGFLRNLSILEHIRHGKYNFAIEHHEMDNVVEFIEDLPIKKTEVNRLRIALTYNKLIDILEAVRIIDSEGDDYVLDRIFQHDYEMAVHSYHVKKEHSGKTAKIIYMKPK